MFQAGERIVCDHNGVCRILSIAERPGLKKGTLYYELEPVRKTGKPDLCSGGQQKAGAAPGDQPGGGHEVDP